MTAKKWKKENGESDKENRREKEKKEGNSIQAKVSLHSRSLPHTHTHRHRHTLSRLTDSQTRSQEGNFYSICTNEMQPHTSQPTNHLHTAERACNGRDKAPVPNILRIPAICPHSRSDTLLAMDTAKCDCCQMARCPCYATNTKARTNTSYLWSTSSIGRWFSCFECLFSQSK